MKRSAGKKNFVY